MTTRVWLASFTGAFLAGTLLAGTYYVDSKAGNDRASGTSPRQAWRTLKRVNEPMFKPGDRILFKAGSRFEGQLKPRGSGALIDGRPAPIVIDMYGRGSKPRIDGNGQFLETLHLYNIEYWEINSLEVTNQGPERQPRRKGVLVEAQDFGTARHIHLKNLYVHDVNGSNIKKEGGGDGIHFRAGGKKKPSRFDGLLIEGCRLERCDRNGVTGGGYWRRYEWFPHLNVVIRKNVLVDIGGDGIVPQCCRGALVEWNVLRDSGSRTPPGDAAAGIWPWSCDDTVVQFNEASGQKGYWDAQGFDSDWNCRNTVIQYNYSHDNEGGFLLICNDGGQTAQTSAGNAGTIVRYNLSVNDGYRPPERMNWRQGPLKGTAFSPVFHISGPLESTRIYNNTVYVGRKPAPNLDHTLIKLDTWNGWPKDTLFQNNIFYAEDWVRYDYGQAAGTVFENNLYYGRHENAPEDGRAIRADPLFVKPGAAAPSGYRLRSGSPALGAGLPIPENGGRDFAGKPVRLPASLGAFEPGKPGRR